MLFHAISCYCVISCVISCSSCAILCYLLCYFLQYCGISCHLVFLCKIVQSSGISCYLSLHGTSLCQLTLHTDAPCDHIRRSLKGNKNCRHLCQNAAIRVVMTAPIFFWRNSDLFKKKNIFLAQILSELEQFENKENL